MLSSSLFTSQGSPYSTTDRLMAALWNTVLTPIVQGHFQKYSNNTLCMSPPVCNSQLHLLVCSHSVPTVCFLVWARYTTLLKTWLIPFQTLQGPLTSANVQLMMLLYTPALPLWWLTSQHGSQKYLNMWPVVGVFWSHVDTVLLGSKHNDWYHPFLLTCDWQWLSLALSRIALLKNRFDFWPVC